jgi:hypothetical protein
MVEIWEVIPIQTEHPAHICNVGGWTILNVEAAVNLNKGVFIDVVPALV